MMQDAHSGFAPAFAAWVRSVFTGLFAAGLLVSPILVLLVKPLGPSPTRQLVMGVCPVGASRLT